MTLLTSLLTAFREVCKETFVTTDSSAVSQTPAATSGQKRNVQLPSSTQESVSFEEECDVTSVKSGCLVELTSVTGIKTY